jgi:HEAT repeat protein
MFGHNKFVNAAAILSSTLVVSMAAMPVFAQSRFSDVNDSYWASEYVRSLTSSNIISGFPEGTFQPDAQMTRAQFASILSRGFAQADKRAPMTFRDVPSNHWAAGAIASAYRQGFLQGYPDGSFGPEQPITRLEVLVALSNGLGIAQPSGDADQMLSAFDDRGAIPEWARGAIAAATQNQLVVNYPNVRQLNPSRNASRAEIVAIAHQALFETAGSRDLANPVAPTYVAKVSGSTPAPVSSTPAPTPAAPTPTPVATTPTPTATDEFSELVALLSSNDASTRRKAADDLAASGKAAVPEIAEALESDKALTRAAAAYALNKIGPDAAAATPKLLEVLKDDDELVRALATSTLAQVGLDENVLITVLTAAIQNESGLVKDVAADALVKIGAEAVPALGNVLKSKSANSLAKQVAATLIGDINQADELGDAALQSAIPILAETLGDGDSDVRKAAAKSLGDFGPLADVAIPALSRALLGENSGVSQTAATSLMKIGQQSVPGLTEALDSDNTLTRLYAADAIWTLTKDSSLILPTLVSVLSEGDVETRELAALGLTYLGRQALPAVPAVRNLMRNDNRRAVNIAQLALMILNNKNEPAPNLGLLTAEPEELNSVPAVVEAVSLLWR